MSKSFGSFYYNPMPTKLTQADFCRTARILGCPVESIQAVAKVESGGRGGFDEKGRLLARFEGHHFRKYTNGKYDQSNPNVSYPYSQQRSKPHGYSAFNEAFALDQTAALLSCSYGMFQVLGSHFDDLGFQNVGAFIDYLKKGEAEQLDVFVRFCRVNGLVDELQRVDFAGFARIYNGASYKDFNYDGQMRGYYNGLKSKNINCEQFQNTSISTADPQNSASQSAGVVLPNPNPNQSDSERLSNQTLGASDGGGLTALNASEQNRTANQASAPETSQTAEQITNVNTSDAAPTVEAAQSLPTTEIEKTKPTNFGAKLLTFILSVIAGEKVIPQWISDGVGANSDFLLKTLLAVFNGVYSQRYLILTSIVVWVVVKKANNAWLSNKIIETNTNPERGNVVLVDRKQPTVLERLKFW